MAQSTTSIEKKLSQETPEAVASGESGPDVVMPDIYAEKHAETQPLLKILDPNAPVIDNSEGFNPYDTAVFLKVPDLKPR